MLKKMTVALLMTTAIIANSGLSAQVLKPEAGVQAKVEVETKVEKVGEIAVNEAAIKQAKRLYAEADKIQTQITADQKQIKSLNSKIAANQQKVDALLVKAADIETRAYKLGKKTRQGSHVSIATIKRQYKNCVNCTTETAKNCKRVKGTHKHYYCFCD